MGFLSWPMLGDHMTYNNLHTLQIHVCKKHNIWPRCLGQRLPRLARELLREHESLAWGHLGQCLQFGKEGVRNYHGFQGAVLNVSVIGLWFLKCVTCAYWWSEKLGSLTYNFPAYISPEHFVSSAAAHTLNVNVKQEISSPTQPCSFDDAAKGNSGRQPSLSPQPKTS